MPQFKKLITIFFIGAVGYSAMEIFWRGFTHWSMSLAGGCCLCGIYTVNDRAKSKGKIGKCAICTAIITSIEFIFGVVFNLILHMHIWDYSRFKFNLLGQICLVYSFIWFLISFPALKLCEYLKRNVLV